MRTLLALLGIAILCVGAQAQVTKTAKGYLFRVKFVPKRVYSYSISSNISPQGGAQSYTITGPLVVTILSRQGTTGTVKVEFGPLFLSGQGVMSKITKTVKEDSLGHALNSGTQQMWVPFSATAKKVGESWTGETSAAGMGSQSTVKAKYKFLGMTTLHGHSVAKLAATIVSSGQANASGSGTIYILAEDGSIWSSQLNLLMNAPQAPEQKLRVSATMTRK